MRGKLFAIALLSVACARGPEGTNTGDCEDGEDNDADKKVDCEDEGCTADEYCAEILEQARAAASKAEADRARTEASQTKNVEQNTDLPYLNIEGLWVQKAHNGADIAFRESEAYCASLELAGHDDWRLPTEREAVEMARSNKLLPEPYVMWTSTNRGKKRGIIVGITSAATNELGLVYDGDCRARCVRKP